jgi:uncharacterized membrane protein
MVVHMQNPCDGPENTTDTGSATEPYAFDVILHPHRSLSPTGFFILMLFIVGVSFSAGLAFLSQGAWPIFGFFGLDVLLIYAAFKFNYRDGRMFETIQMGAKELLVRRVFPSGRVRVWTFEPAWMGVLMDNPPEHHSQLVLTLRDKRLTVGAFLSPKERLEVSDALKTALAVWRRGDPDPRSV